MVDTQKSLVERAWLTKEDRKKLIHPYENYWDDDLECAQAGRDQRGGRGDNGGVFGMIEAYHIRYVYRQKPL